MARPQKHTAPYFFHDGDASVKRTVSILENHFQHEGSSAWWKLLETLASTEYHVIYLKSSEDVEYLSSKMHFKPARLLEILIKMAELDAIDSRLFQYGIIWSQNFVNRLEPLYKKRNQVLPVMPTLNGTETPLSVSITPLSLPEMLHSKLNITRFNLNKPEYPLNPPINQSPAALLKKEFTFSQKESDIGITDKNLAAIVTSYENNIGMITPAVADELQLLADDFSPEWFAEATKEACLHNARTLSYITKILDRWKVQGYKAPFNGGKNGKYQSDHRSIPGNRPAGAFSNL